MSDVSDGRELAGVKVSRKCVSGDRTETYAILGLELDWEGQVVCMAVIAVCFDKQR